MPKHHFVIENKSLVSGNIHNSYSWDSHGMIHKSGLTREDHATLEDEFIAYIYDFLRWLDTWNPSTCMRSSGLNNYGITVIEEQDALLKFHQLIQVWIDLFGHATDPIVLTGSYCFDEEEQRSYYEKLVYNKVELINELHKLANMAKRAEINGKCIVHFGI
ncbi:MULTISPECIES: hypothetical protein [unclassified Paenibacillus]|uniref:hypothetical protein n=1 Tax=unclassified Paenibacillus TaxID=185978 RepID=UPI000CFD4ED2|nr:MULTISPECIES: hypothetical protein [unclassified Paenibacillus]PRA08718.1 hypothetical protein CQ043_01685 [Paenibacillus sp. MYb63]PRA48652.1 hypothetical protein CQ061_10140 [Paenibacillus sp. MYb67]